MEFPKNFKDETGNLYGYLKVLLYAGKRIQPSGQSKTLWKCKCLNCGSIVNIDAYALRSGNSKSCNNCKKTNRDNSIKDISGNKYGQLTVLSLYKVYNCKTYWNCLCSCGNKTIVSKSNLLNGNTKSCGCLLSYHLSVIQKYLSLNNILFLKQFSFLDLVNKSGNHLRFDFAIFNNSKLCFLLLYQGLQHFILSGLFGRYQRLYSDTLKKQYCDSHNIPLHYINYYLDKILSLNNILHKYMLIPCQVES